MASAKSGGGALGWTLLGFLAGVAATLGLQILAGGERPGHAEPAAESARSVEAAPPPAPVAPAHHAVSTAAASSTAPAVRPPAQPADEVADDAAAAGMTSRLAPTQPEGDAAPADGARN